MLYWFTYPTLIDLGRSNFCPACPILSLAIYASSLSHCLLASNCKSSINVTDHLFTNKKRTLSSIVEPAMVLSFQHFCSVVIGLSKCQTRTVRFMANGWKLKNRRVPFWIVLFSLFAALTINFVFKSPCNIASQLHLHTCPRVCKVFAGFTRRWLIRLKSLNQMA